MQMKILLFCALLMLLATKGNAVLQRKRRMDGGFALSIEDAMFVVKIHTGISHGCTGCLIRSAWVVTAANCVTKPPVESIIVVGNTTDYNDANQVTRGVLKKHIPTLYQYFKLNYDVALLELSAPLTGINVRPINYDRSAELEPSDKLFMYGYQNSKLWGGFLKILQLGSCRYSLGIHLRPSYALCTAHKVNSTAYTVQFGHGDAGCPILKSGELVAISSLVVHTRKGVVADLSTKIKRFAVWMERLLPPRDMFGYYEQ